MTRSRAFASVGTATRRHRYRQTSSWRNQNYNKEEKHESEILVPLDGSAEAEGVLPLVRDLMTPESEVILFQVIPPGKSQSFASVFCWGAKWRRPSGTRLWPISDGSSTSWGKQPAVGAVRLPYPAPWRMGS